MCAVFFAVVELWCARQQHNSSLFLPLLLSAYTPAPSFFSKQCAAQIRELHARRQVGTLGTTSNELALSHKLLFVIIFYIICPCPPHSLRFVVYAVMRNKVRSPATQFPIPQPFFFSFCFCSCTMYSSSPSKTHSS